MIDLEIDDCRAVRNYFLQKLAQLRNVPLTVAKLVDRLADGFVPVDVKRLEKSPAGALDHKVAVEDQQRI